MLEKLPSKNPPGVDALIRQWQVDQDLVARDRLVRQHYGFIQMVAREMARKNDHDFGDAIQCASLGFLRAIDKYDPAVPATFKTYARIWMRSFISRQMRYDKMVVHPGHGVENSHAPVRKAKRDLERKGIKATPEAIAAACGFTVERVNSAIYAQNLRMTSLDAPVSEHMDGGDTTVGDMMPAPEETRPDLLVADKLTLLGAREAIEAAERVLSPRELDVVRQRIWEERTLDEIKQGYGVSRERIRQIEAKAFEKLATVLKHDRRAQELIS